MYVEKHKLKYDESSEFRKFEETDNSIHQKNCYLYLMDRTVH